MDIFVFGTLLHIPLLEEVSGDPRVRDRITWGVRPDFTVSRVDGQEFPMMHEASGQSAEGMIISGLSEDALARLDYYEKAFGYDRVDFVVHDANQDPRTVTAYITEVDRWSPAEPWDRDSWISKRGEVTTIAAKEAMSAIDRMSAVQMGQTYPQMMSRAESRHRAITTAAGGQVDADAVNLIQIKRGYTGFCNVDEVDLSFRRFDGEMSEPVNRCVFVGVDCAIVLPYDPVRDRVLIVEQFRTGAYLRGDPNPWTFEPIAGRIDPKETPEDAAVREAKEEAGVTLRDLKCVAAAYPSPGTTTEHFYVYVGLCDLPDGSCGLGGEEDEAEDIRSRLMEWDDFDRALNSGDFRVLPLIVAGHWLARNREAMRGSA